MARCFILCESFFNCTPIRKNMILFLSIFKFIFPDMKLLYFYAPIGVQMKNDSGTWRGVPFWHKGHVARCFILCESLLNCTPIGKNNIIFLSIIKVIFCLYEVIVFLWSYRGAIQEWLRHLAWCSILTQRARGAVFHFVWVILELHPYKEEQHHISLNNQNHILLIWSNCISVLL